LSIDSVVQDGVFVTDSVSYQPDENLAQELSAEADWKRRGLYAGPEFGDLDEELQGSIEAYLEERGLNSDLATAILDLIVEKEQREYISWLENVRNFVKA
jgi:complement component 1 Q subcomponent-binding protein